jgi:lysyl-tRNA synthetase class II
VTTVEELLKQLISGVNDIKENVIRIDAKLFDFEKRLTRLEKVDSIEHRVEVNQIDLSDIKEIVEKIEKFQKEQILPMAMHINDLHYAEEFTKLNNRLDAHLAKIAKNEEAILLLSKNQ